jgi:hypothetical protein
MTPSHSLEVANVVNQTKAEALAALERKGIQRRSFSRGEFCARNGISEGHYRGLRKKGLGPREVHLGELVIITVEDESAWLKKNAKQSA